MVQSSRNDGVVYAMALCVLTFENTSAFVGPPLQPLSALRNPPHHAAKARNSCPRIQMSVQSKENMFDTLTDEEDENRKSASEMLRVTNNLTDSFQEEREISVTEIQHVYTTSEEAAVFLADAPVTPPIDITSGEGLLWRGVVVILCALWASNFAIAKVVLAEPGVDASLFAVARFSLAALSLLPGTLNAVRKGAISWETAKGALICGSWVSFGYLGQLIGLMDTTASRSCVICSLNCIFVAIVSELMRLSSSKDRGYSSDFDLKKLIPALVAVTGVAIIELKGAAGSPNMGDLISFAQPIGFGMGYLQLEELMKKQPSAALPVSAIKLAVVASAALAFFELSPHSVDLATSVDPGVAIEGAKQSLGLGLKIPDFTPIVSSPIAIGAVLYTGILTTSLALWVESIAFQRVSATDASMILTTEPLFAAAVSAALIGETFGVSDAVGAMFIVGACVYAIQLGDTKEVCDEEDKTCVVEELK